MAKALLRWLATADIETALLEPSTPCGNGVGESINGSFRDDCLSLEWFCNRTDSQIVIKAWRHHYNQVLPHSSLDNLTPAECKRRCTTSCPAEAICQD